MARFRVDAGEFPNPDLAAFTERELEYVREEVLQKKQRELAGEELIPQVGDVPAYQEKYVHQMYELLGRAEFVGDDVEDFPLVDFSLSEEVFNIRKLGVAYKHTMDEIEKSEALGRGLDTKRANAARRAMELKLNEIMWYGDQRQQLFGALNYPDSPHVVLSNTIDDTTNPDVIKDMLTDLLTSIYSATNQTAEPDSIWLPTEAYFHIVDTELNPSGGGDSTIMEWIVEKHPFIESMDDIRNVQELDNAGPNDNDLIVVGRMQDGDSDNVLQHKMVKPFKQRAPQTRNEAVITNAVAKTGGCASDFPQEFLVAEVPNT